MRTTRGTHTDEHRDIAANNVRMRKAVGYIRVSTDMQAADGLSLDAQTAAIEQYCSMQGLRLVRVCQDVISGAKDQRPGLEDALGTLQRGADVLVVLKFDRLSRSIKHFCNLYDAYFKSGEKELVAIRESIRLDSSLGRALVSILLVFAQMEREATAERTRESVWHIKRRGYHHGKVPYGFKAVPAADNPRFKVLVENPDQQAILARIKSWFDAGEGVPEMAARLNADGTKPPVANTWNSSYLYLLSERYQWRPARPHNQRHHTDEEARARIVELRDLGHTFQQIASILNEEKWRPLKGRKFTMTGVWKLLRGTEQTTFLSPKRYLEALLRRMEEEHAKLHQDEPFKRPGLPRLAVILKEVGYRTPKGHDHWWPAQVQQLLDGRFDQYYANGAGQHSRRQPNQPAL